MTITLNDIERVWRMTDETASGIYDQATVSGYLYDFDEDKNAVASVIWAEKAASLQATSYDLSADGASYSYNQKMENAWYLAKYYGSKRSPTTSLWIKSPDEEDDSDTLQVG